MAYELSYNRRQFTTTAGLSLTSCNSPQGSLLGPRLYTIYVNDLSSQTRIDATWMQSSEREGCPQGSCFGPLLWNIYQNDLNYYLTGQEYLNECGWPPGICIGHYTSNRAKKQLQELGDVRSLYGTIKIYCKAALRRIKPSLLDQTKSTWRTWGHSAKRWNELITWSFHRQWFKF